MSPEGNANAVLPEALPEFVVGRLEPSPLLVKAEVASMDDAADGSAISFKRLR
jgi:hypothetical protein